MAKSLAACLLAIVVATALPGVVVVADALAAAPIVVNLLLIGYWND